MRRAFGNQRPIACNLHFCPFGEKDRDSWLKGETNPLVKRRARIGPVAALGQGRGLREMIAQGYTSRGQDFDSRAYRDRALLGVGATVLLLLWGRIGCGFGVASVNECGSG